MTLAFFGLVAPVGLWMLNRVSHRLGFGTHPQPVPGADAALAFFAAAELTSIGLIFGNRGGG